MSLRGRRILITGGSGFIGSNFLDAVVKQGSAAALNLDLQDPPGTLTQFPSKRVDLLDATSLMSAFADFEPTEVVHFAGRTDMFGASVDDYAANHIGTMNLIRAINASRSVERTVFTSSQFVVGPGAMPKDDLDFRPHTIYGQSKVLSEQAVREAKLNCIWTIIRPTNIWGMRHPRYPCEFWRVLHQGRYFHPAGRSVTRCYGYAGNVVEQIFRILASAPERVDRKVFYVGDAPTDLYEWTNAFSLELTGKSVRVMPRQMLRGLAMLGDVIIACGGTFPIFSSRYRSMTEDYIVPMEPTFEVLGPSQISMQEGVRQTVDWLVKEKCLL